MIQIQKDTFMDEKCEVRLNSHFSFLKMWGTPQFAFFIFKSVRYASIRTTWDKHYSRTHTHTHTHSHACIQPHSLDWSRFTNTHPIVKIASPPHLAPSKTFPSISTEKMAVVKILSCIVTCVGKHGRSKYWSNTITVGLIVMLHDDLCGNTWAVKILIKTPAQWLWSYYTVMILWTGPSNSVNKIIMYIYIHTGIHTYYTTVIVLRTWSSNGVHKIIVYVYIYTGVHTLPERQQRSYNSWP